jgi:hypothetical protein
VPSVSSSPLLLVLRSSIVVIDEWLSCYAINPSRLTTERDRRNGSSYRPTDLTLASHYRVSLILVGLECKKKKPLKTTNWLHSKDLEFISAAIDSNAALISRPLPKDLTSYRVTGTLLGKTQFMEKMEKLICYILY